MILTCQKVARRPIDEIRRLLRNRIRGRLCVANNDPKRPIVSNILNNCQLVGKCHPIIHKSRTIREFGLCALGEEADCVGSRCFNGSHEKDFVIDKLETATKTRSVPSNE